MSHSLFATSYASSNTRRRPRSRSSTGRSTSPLRTQLAHQGEFAVAHAAFVQWLLELGLAGEPDLAGRGGLDQGGEILSLGGRETRRVEVALLLLEEPHAPGEGDEDAARLGAGDLALPPLHLERRLFVHVP